MFGKSCSPGLMNFAILRIFLAKKEFIKKISPGFIVSSLLASLISTKPPLFEKVPGNNSVPFFITEPSCTFILFK